jgi:SAM-dependent methyltransferase
MVRRSAIATPQPPPSFDPKAYWEDRLTRHPGLTGVGSTLFGIYYNGWLYRVRRRVFYRLMRSLKDDFRSDSVFDIGSGTGFYLELWRKLGVKSVTGSDLTNASVSRLKAAFAPIRIIRMDIGGDLEASQHGRYNIVSAFDVLFHIVDDAHYGRALENAHSLLAPGGLFVFSDLLIHEPLTRGEHVVFRPLEAVMKELTRLGFEVVRRVPMFVMMEYPHDTKSRVYCFYWRVLTFLLRQSAWVGLVLGGIFYPIELVLTALFRESPTTEIIVCRKATGGIFRT